MRGLARELIDARLPGLVVPREPDFAVSALAEAFDEAVTKYPGVWVYRECIGEKQKLVNVRTRSF